VRDTAVRHLDADGDEIMQPGKGLGDGIAELAEDVLRMVQLRERESSPHPNISYQAPVIQKSGGISSQVV
jgi:hypothetical protein